jgi:hypothetical protein
MGRTATQRDHDRGLPDVEVLQAVLARAGIDTFDLLLAGDGSGTGWGDHCGWACTLIDGLTRGRKLFYGGMNAASVNMAELMPYYQAICWFEHTYGRARRKQYPLLQTHIITDSQVIATWGTQAADLSRPLPSTGIMYLAGLRELARMGYQLHYHWLPRATSQLNQIADLVATLSRRELMRCVRDDAATIALRERVIQAMQRVRFCDPNTGEPILLQDLNPDENDHGRISSH